MHLPIRLIHQLISFRTVSPDEFPEQRYDADEPDRTISEQACP